MMFDAFGVAERCPERCPKGSNIIAQAECLGDMGETKKALLPKGQQHLDQGRMPG